MALLILYTVLALDVLSLAMTFTILPTYIYEMEGSHFFLGAIGSASAFVTLIWNPTAGALSDRLGKKRILLACLFICFVANFLLAYWPALWVICISRILAALGSPINTFVKSFVDDIVKSKDERSSSLNKMQAIGGACFIFGPLISGHLADHPNGIRTAIYIISAMFAVNFGLILLVEDKHKKEKNTANNKSKQEDSNKTPSNKVLDEIKSIAKRLTSIDWQKYWDIVTIKIIYEVTLHVFYFNFGLIITEHFALGGKSLSYVIASLSVVGIAVSLIMIKVKSWIYSTDDTGMTRLNHGLILLCTSFVGLGLSGSFPVFVAFLLPMSVARVYLDTTITEVTMSRASATEKGSIMGTLDSTMSIAGLVAPILCGIASDKLGEQTSLLLCAIPTLVSIAVTYQKVKVA